LTQMHLEVCNETLIRIIKIYASFVQPKLLTEPKIMPLS